MERAKGFEPNRNQRSVYCKTGVISHIPTFNSWTCLTTEKLRKNSCRRLPYD
jgi:hypothetical protein